MKASSESGLWATAISRAWLDELPLAGFTVSGTAVIVL
jgi:hypothetical protein